MAPGLTDPIPSGPESGSGPGSGSGSGSELLQELCRRHRDLVLQLRDLDHWRRLLTARLDLAVAAVTGLDEPTATMTEGPPPGFLVPPYGLRALLGMPLQLSPGGPPVLLGADDRLAETSLLPRLRQALADLDSYALALQTVVDQAERALAHGLEELRVPD